MKTFLKKFLCVVVGTTSSAAYADQMFWVDRGNNTVEYADRDGTNRGSFAIGTFGTGVAVDPLSGTVYWSENGTDKVRRADLNGSNATDVLTGVDALGLDLDVYRGKIYWTMENVGGSGTRVRRANLDGTNVETVVTVTGLTFPLGFALDVRADKVYWTEFLTQKVKRANLDSTQVQELVTSGGNVTEIALDTTNGKMYWGSCTGPIRRANLDGTSVETVIPNTGGTLCASGIDLDVPAGKLYWTNENTASVHRANLDGTNIENLVTSGTPSPEHLALDTPPEIPAAVPTASTWGLAALSLALLIGGVCVLRRSAPTGA
jgi:hypothetical protein